MNHGTIHSRHTSRPLRKIANDDTYPLLGASKSASASPLTVIAALIVVPLVIAAFGMSVYSTWAVHNDIGTKSLSFSQQSYTTSGALQSSHNVHLLNGNGTALSMTLPADLSPFVGKHLKICSVSGQQDVIALQGGNTFDADGYWTVVRFEGKTPCCIELHVLAADKVNVIDKTCALYCATDNLFHCVDPERPEETNPFHGYWRAVTKGMVASNLFPDQLGNNVPLVYIDMKVNPPIVRGWRGTVNAVREPTIEDGGAAERPLYAFDATALLTEETDNVVNSDLFVWALKLQSDSTEIVVQFARETIAYDLEVFPYRKISASQVPPIIPANTGKLSGGLDPHNPVALLENSIEMWLHAGNDQTAVEMNNENFIGVPAALALKDEIISVGKTYTTPALKIFKTQNSSIPLTRIRTETDHHVAPVARITVSGCTGDWAAMNGQHLVSAPQTTRLPRINGLFRDFSTNASARTYHYDVTIFFDSNAFSADGDGIATSTGSCEISVSYGPIDAATEYLETVSAFYFWFEEAVGVAQHTRPVVVFDASSATAGDFSTAKPRETWAQVKADYAAGTQLEVSVRSRIGTASSFYVNLPLILQYVAVDFGIPSLDFRAFGLDINNRFGVKPNEDLTVNSQWWYNIPLENYLVDVKVPYYRCTGLSKTHPDNLFAAFVFGQDGCDSFESLMVNYTELPPSDDYNFYVSSAPLNGASPFGVDYSLLTADELARYRSIFYAGRINPAYTGGASIGYIRATSMFNDDILGFSAQGEFLPDEADDTFRSPREAKTKIMSSIFKYLVTDLAVEHIIFDQRSNLGGFTDSTIAWREFVGGDEQIHTITDIPVAGAPNAPLVNLSSVQLLNQLPLEQLGTVAPSLSEEFYPGSVFTEGEFILLTDFRASSAGDIHPNYYLGAALDRNIGNATHVQILGDIDGRNAGYSCGDNAIPTASNDARIRDSLGNPVGAIQMIQSFDCGSTLRRVSDGSFMSNRIPALQPDCAPTLTGLSGGCALPNDEETLLFPDLGFLPNTRARLVGDARPQTPTPSNRDEWRDAWLEEAVRAALAAKKRKRFPAPKRKKRSLKPRKNIHARDVLCPPGIALKHLREVNGTIVVNYHNKGTPKAIRASAHHAKQQGAKIMAYEMKSGGLCVNSQGHVMVTPKCQGLPKLVMA